VCRSPEEIKNQANEQYKQGRYEEAIKLYTQAIGKHQYIYIYCKCVIANTIPPIDASPKTATYYNNRAAALMMQKKYKDAANDCRLATQLDPQNAKAYLRGGKCHLNLGNLEEAGRQYNLAYELDANAAQRDYNNLQHVHNYMAQVNTFMANQQWGLARNSLDRAIAFVDADTLPVKWRVMQAECALGEKNYSEASRIVK
jgi:DnaJ family protein C protein 7